jgi:hypothetical protein
LYFVDSDLFRNKVIGFHYAGFTDKAGGCMIPLFREDFESIMVNEVSQLDVEGVKYEPIDLPLEVHKQGVTNLVPFTSTRTQFEKTSIHGKIQTSTVKPAKLGRLTDPDGPAMKGLLKNTKDVVAIDPDLLLQAKESVRCRLFLGKTEEYERRILTFDEAVAGIEGTSYIRGINRSRSAGWPWCLQTNDGKKAWFGKEAWILNGEKPDEVRRRVEQLQDQMTCNEWEPAVFIDTQKDETRSIEKVDAGKTRMFAAAPMDFIILFRIYFLGFISCVMRNRIRNEVCVGIQAQSRDWDKLARYLLEPGQDIVAGDFSNYDGDLHPDIMKTICELINEWYDDEWSQHRRIIFQSLCHSTHICEKFVYSLTHSQPSGNPGTAIINSIYNSIVCRLCYYQLEKENGLTGSVMHDRFNLHVRMASYGDDNLLSVGDGSKWFTMREMARVMPLFGMTYTSEQKDGKLYDFKNLRDCFFLQRGFRFDDETGAWFGPLKQDSINERMNWMQRVPNKEEVLQLNMVGAVAEWALHDQETFEKWRRKITRVALDDLNFPIRQYPWKWYKDTLLWGDYSKTFPQLEFT